MIGNATLVGYVGEDGSAAALPPAPSPAAAIAAMLADEFEMQLDSDKVDEVFSTSEQLRKPTELPIYGDANGDGIFDNSDLVEIFSAGEYEDDIAGNSDWSEGDWNGDDDFTSSDLVLALKRGNYRG